MQAIGKYFSLSKKQADQFAQLESLYTIWNQRINVISRKDIGHLYLHHVLHSLAVAKVITFLPGSVIMDAGTGGGFPGIPLAILFPDSSFILADSIKKKITVVEAIISETGLTNCSTRNMRLEDMMDQSDFVVCRAVTEIPRLFGWVKKNIRPGGVHPLKNGLLALKGGDLSSELAPMGKHVKVFDISDYFDEPYFETKKLVYLER